MMSAPALAQSEPQGGIPIAPIPQQVLASAPWLYAWVGGGFTNGFQGGYAGFVQALNPQKSLSADGFVIRGDVMAGQYNAGSLNLGGADETVETHGASFMAGYKWILPTGSIAVFVGPSYEFHNNHALNASLSGGEAGPRGVIEHEWNINPNLSLASGISGATAFNVWYTYSQLAYKLNDAVKIGPEVIYYSNEAPYRELRTGAFVRFNTAVGEVTLSGGYRDPMTDSPSGYYVNLVVGRGFY
jgi:hypothetical protein